MKQESQTIEFKETWRDEFLKTICAFANTDGGTLYVGVNDKGVSVGVKNCKKLLEDLPNKVMSNFALVVDVKILIENGFEIIEIIVPKSKMAISYQGRFYTRSGSTTQELKGAALQRLLLKTNNLTWDGIGVENATFEDIDQETVSHFVKKAIENNRLSTDANLNDLPKLFKNLNLITQEGELTRAAILLFGKKPTQYFISATLKIGRFRGTDSTDLIAHDLIEDNLFNTFTQAMERLRIKYLLSPVSYQGMVRVEPLEIPVKAIREAILNALIHRDYTEHASITIKVFDPTVIIWNSGISEVAVEKLDKNHESLRRNPIIADIFYRSGYIEAWGRGTNTIINECVKSGLTAPVFKTRQDGLEIIFERNPMRLTENGITKQFTQLSDRQRKAVEYVQLHGSISNKIYQELCGVSKPTATRDLQEIVALGFLQKIGTSGESIKYILVGS